MTPRSFTRKQAAEYTGLSVTTIKRAIAAGDLKTYRPRIDGREVETDLILISDLEAWAFPGLASKEADR